MKINQTFKVKFRGIVISFCLLSSFCAIAAKPTHTLWLATAKDGTRIYIYPATHSGTLQFDKLPKNINAAIAQSDIFLSEFGTRSITHLLPPEHSKVSRDYRISPPKINDTARQRLEKLVIQGYINSELARHILIATPVTYKNNLSNKIVSIRHQKGEWNYPEHPQKNGGNDFKAHEFAQSLKMRIEALDEGQLTAMRFWLINCESESNNSAMLVSAIEDAFNNNSLLARFKLNEQWLLTGDFKKYEENFRLEYAFSASVSLAYNCHVVPRNYLWINVIQEIKRKSPHATTIFLTAGALHMVDLPSKRQSLIALLKDAGYNVSRVFN